MDYHHTPEYKMVVLGGGGTDKSALTITLVTDNFLERYDPTIEDSYRKAIELEETVNGKTERISVIMDILDTAGQEEWSSMQDQWMREGKGFLLVYSITSRSTFDEIPLFRDKILRANDEENVPIVIVGNKCDLEDQRQVSKEEGMQLAQEYGYPFFETSAKERINNVECFVELVREIRRIERLSDPSFRPSKPSKKLFSFDRFNKASKPKKEPKKPKKSSNKETNEAKQEEKIQVRLFVWLCFYFVCLFANKSKKRVLYMSCVCAVL